MVRAMCAHAALASCGEHHAMSVNLGKEFESQVLAKGSEAKRFLTNRIAYHLRTALRRRVEFWFVLELSEPPARRLHFHGEIACTATEAKRARKALRAAAGEWDPSARRHQVHTDPRPDVGQVSYAFKQEPLLVTERFLNLPRAESWRDDPFMITQGLKNNARKVYEALRRVVTLPGNGLRKIA
jgi:Cu/Zn superoxide dismutase